MFPLKSYQSILDGANHLWERITQHSDRLHKLELKVMALTEDIATITAEVNDLRAAIASEKAEVAAGLKVLSDKVAELEAAIAAGTPAPDLSGIIQGLKDATAEVKAIVEPTV